MILKESDNKGEKQIYKSNTHGHINIDTEDFSMLNNWAKLIKVKQSTGKSGFEVPFSIKHYIFFPLCVSVCFFICFSLTLGWSQSDNGDQPVATTCEWSISCSIFAEKKIDVYVRIGKNSQRMSLILAWVLVFLDCSYDFIRTWWMFS